MINGITKISQLMQSMYFNCKDPQKMETMNLTACLNEQQNEIMLVFMGKKSSVLLIRFAKNNGITYLFLQCQSMTKKSNKINIITIPEFIKINSDSIVVKLFLSRITPLPVPQFEKTWWSIQGIDVVCFMQMINQAQNNHQCQIPQDKYQLVNQFFTYLNNALNPTPNA